MVLLGVTADDDRAAYTGWVTRNTGKYAFTMSFDPAGRANWKESVFNTKYFVSGFPTMFVIGRDGRIVETVGGGGPGEDYRLESPQSNLSSVHQSNNFRLVPFVVIFQNRQTENH